MQYLLDTHALIWFLEDGPQLTPKVRSEIIDIHNRCFISIASIWEIAIKASLNKLQLKSDFHKIREFLSDTEIEILPIEFDHLQKLLSLDYHHRDPFDRLIIAQAITENLTILSRDEHFRSYTNNVLWG